MCTRSMHAQCRVSEARYNTSVDFVVFIAKILAAIDFLKIVSRRMYNVSVVTDVR